MADVEWLDGDELQTWKALTRAMIKLLAALDRQLQTDARLSHFEYGILSSLSEAPDRTIQMSFLANMANGSLSRLSHAISRLEDRGWVVRAPNACDRRLTEATLTPAGFDKVREASEGHVRLVRSMVFDVLSEGDLRFLSQVAEAILERVEAE